MVKSAKSQERTQCGKSVSRDRPLIVFTIIILGMVTNDFHHHHHHYHHEKRHCHSRRLFLHIWPSFLYNCSNSSHGKGAKLRPRHVIYNFERYSQRITVITRKHILFLYQDMSLLHNLGATFFLITLYRDYRVLVC